MPASYSDGIFLASWGSCGRGPMTTQPVCAVWLETSMQCVAVCSACHVSSVRYCGSLCKSTYIYQFNPDYASEIKSKIKIRSQTDPISAQLNSQVVIHFNTHACCLLSDRFVQLSYACSSQSSCAHLLYIHYERSEVHYFACGSFFPWRVYV